MALAILMVCTVMPVMTLATETDTNLIANGSFDTGAEGWVYGLRAGNSTEATTPELSTMEVVSNDGENSFHVVKDETEQLMLFCHVPDAKLVQDETYYVSLRVKADGDLNDIAFRVRSGNKVNGVEYVNLTNIILPSSLMPKTDGWKLIHGFFKYSSVKVDNQYVWEGFSIIADMTSATSDTTTGYEADFYIDDVRVAARNDLVEGSNLIGNGDFEEDLIGWKAGLVQAGSESSRFIANTFDEVKNNFSVDDSEDDGHETALHIVGAAAKRIAAAQYIPLTATEHGQAFKISFSANLKSGKVDKIGIRAGDKINGTEIKTFTLEAADTGWHNYSQIFSYNQAYAGVSFLVDVDDEASCEIWIDDVVVEKVQLYDGMNLVGNNSFKYGLYGWTYGTVNTGLTTGITTGNESKFSVVDFDGHEDVLCVKNDTGTRIGIKQYFELTQNDDKAKFLVSVSVNLKSGTLSRIGIRGGDRMNGDSNKQPASGIALKSADSGWHTYSFEFTYDHANAVSKDGGGGFSFLIDSASSGLELYVDDVVIIREASLLSGDNKIGNSSFDYGLLGWKYGSISSSGGISEPTDSFKIKDSTQKIGTVGEDALHIEKNSATREGIYQHIPLTDADKGKQYQVTAYMDLISGTISRFGLRGGNQIKGSNIDNCSFYIGTTSSTHPGISTPTNGWRRHSFVFTYAGGNDGVSFVVDLNSGAANLWLDDISVKEVTNLLANDGTFEAYREYVDVEAETYALSLNPNLYQQNQIMQTAQQDDQLKKDMDLVKTVEDGGYALKVIGTTGTSQNPVSVYFNKTKIDNITNNTLLKMTARLKVETTNLADQKTVCFRYGGIYDRDQSEGCVQTSTICIPKENLNQWVDVAFYFNKRAIDSQLVSIVPGVLTVGTDLWVDDLKVVPAEEAFFGAKAYALAETVTVRSSDPVAYETVAAVVDLPATGKAGTNAGFLAVNPAGAGNKMMITGLYRTKDGNRTLVDVQVSAFDKLAGDTVSIPAALEAGGTYAVENYICDGVGTLKPVGEKTTIAVIR